MKILNKLLPDGLLRDVREELVLHERLGHLERHREELLHLLTRDGVLWRSRVVGGLCELLVGDGNGPLRG